MVAYNLTQRDLATLLNYREGYISMLLHGERPPTRPAVQALLRRWPELHTWLVNPCPLILQHRKKAGGT